MIKRAVPALAKLRPARLAAPLNRERLFKRIDAHQGGALWICAPPGAGKTTLVATYLQQRGLDAIWYRLDEGDNDVCGFFRTLESALHDWPSNSRPPRFMAEDAARPLLYARRWFRAVLPRLKRPLCLVFDNLEQADLDVLPAIVGCAVEEAPDTLTVVVTCRHAPPPSLARQILDGRLATMVAAELAFTVDESDAYARAKGLPEAVVRQASDRVAGWAAGLRLLTLPGYGVATEACGHVLFDYFTGLLHDRLDMDTQTLLLACALLPWIDSAIVADLTRLHDVQARLDECCEQNLFVERLDGAPGLYRLHPLMRDFLLNRGQQALTAVRRSAIQREAADALHRQGHTDAAMDLLIDAGDVQTAIDRLVGAFDEKLQAGQFSQLSAWFDRLPTAAREASPALQYGMARLCFLREDVQALAHYHRSFAAYSAEANLLGQQLCASGILEWGYNTDSFIDHERWCAMLRDTPPDQTTSDAEALRLLNGRLLMHFSIGTFDAVAASLTNEVLVRLDSGGSDNEKVSLAITLLGCLERHKRWHEATVLAHRMTLLVASARVGKRLKILVYQQVASDLHRQTGNFLELERLSQKARALAREEGFQRLEVENIALLMFSALYRGAHGRAKVLLEELEAAIVPGDVYHQRLVYQMRTWEAMHDGRVPEAVRHSADLRDAVARSGMPVHLRSTWLLPSISADFLAGREDTACAELESLCKSAEPGSRTTLEANLMGMRAWRLLKVGRLDDAVPALSEAFALAEGMQYYQLLPTLRGPLADLAAFSLERAIASEFVRQLVRRRELPGPPTRMPAWPWRVRIHTLGRFELLVDDRPVAFDVKTPKRPLALLKALIALGGQGVAEHVLADALWPDDDADSAHNSLGVTLHRLRKLIPGGADLIQLRGGRLSLDEASCWVDAHAFEQAAGPPGRGPDSTGQYAPAMGQAIALYTGHFLDEEGGAPWCLGAREKLRNLYQRLIVAHTNALIERGDFEVALACLQQALEIDEQDERFHQGIMRCAIAMRQPAVGLAAYMRLKRTLLLLLGVSPSADSELLHLRLRAHESELPP